MTIGQTASSGGGSPDLRAMRSRCSLPCRSQRAMARPSVAWASLVPGGCGGSPRWLHRNSFPARPNGRLGNADGLARNKLLTLEDLTEAELDKLKESFSRIADRDGIGAGALREVEADLEEAEEGIEKAKDKIAGGTS
jgi:hypothetical protein